MPCVPSKVYLGLTLLKNSIKFKTHRSKLTHEILCRQYRPRKPLTLLYFTLLQGYTQMDTWHNTGHICSRNVSLTAGDSQHTGVQIGEQDQLWEEPHIPEVAELQGGLAGDPDERVPPLLAPPGEGGSHHAEVREEWFRPWDLSRTRPEWEVSQVL